MLYAPGGPMTRLENSQPAWVQGKEKPAWDGGEKEACLWRRFYRSWQAGEYSGLNTVVLHCRIIFAEELNCERGNWNTILLTLPISLLTVVCRIILPGTMYRQPLDEWLQSGNVTAITSGTSGACCRVNTVIRVRPLHWGDLSQTYWLLSALQLLTVNWG